MKEWLMCIARYFIAIPQVGASVIDGQLKVTQFCMYLIWLELTNNFLLPATTKLASGKATGNFKIPGNSMRLFSIEPPSSYAVRIRYTSNNADLYYLASGNLPYSLNPTSQLSKVISERWFMDNNYMQVDLKRWYLLAKATTISTVNNFVNITVDKVPVEDISSVTNATAPLPLPLILEPTEVRIYSYSPLQGAAGIMIRQGDNLGLPLKMTLSNSCSLFSLTGTPLAAGNGTEHFLMNSGCKGKKYLHDHF